MLKYFAVVVSACCLSAGCVNEHIAAIDRYELGTKLQAGDIGKTGFHKMTKVDYQYDYHQVFDKGCNDQCVVFVAPDGEIICVEGDRTFQSPEDAIEFSVDLSKFIVKKYKSGLKDYGARESKYIFRVNADGTNVSYSAMTTGFNDLKEKYESCCDEGVNARPMVRKGE